METTTTSATLPLVLVQEIPLMIGVGTDNDPMQFKRQYRGRNFAGNGASRWPLGRFDHFTFDASKKRLFVACLGADAVCAVDMYAGVTLGFILTAPRPTGLIYLPGKHIVDPYLKEPGAKEEYNGGYLFVSCNASQVQVWPAAPSQGFHDIDLRIAQGIPFV